MTRMKIHPYLTFDGTTEGDYYGMLTDCFGVQWMVNYNAQGANQ